MYKGISLSIASSCLFSILFYYTKELNPLNGESIFGWRTILMLPCITLFLVMSEKWGLAVQLLLQLKERPIYIVYVLLSSFLLASQQFLFVWAPLNGYSLDVSLGYFLLPLLMVLIGKFLYKENITFFQKIAVTFALLGVLNEVYHIGRISWATLYVAIGFALYFVLRKRIGTQHLGGLWFDMLFSTPIAIYLVIKNISLTIDVNSSVNYYLYIKLVFFGFISSLAFILYTVSGKLLPFGVFGLLGYIEPVLLIVAAVVLGEKIKNEQLFTFIPIRISVFVLVIDGCFSVYKSDTLKPLE